MFILSTSASKGNLAKNIKVLATLSTLISGSTLILPSACLVPFPLWAAISVDAFPMSSWVQLMWLFRPSREVHLVRPRMACFEIVYENESEVEDDQLVS